MHTFSSSATACMSVLCVILYNHWLIGKK